MGGWWKVSELVLGRYSLRCLLRCITVVNSGVQNYHSAWITLPLLIGVIACRVSPFTQGAVVDNVEICFVD
jgi:hypothetical protein